MQIVTFGKNNSGRVTVRPKTNKLNIRAHDTDFHAPVFLGGWSRSNDRAIREMHIAVAMGLKSDIPFLIAKGPSRRHSAYQVLRLPRISAPIYSEPATHDA